MPQIFRMGEYWIYFWSNENKPLEPVHVHIAKGQPVENATKVGIIVIDPIIEDNKMPKSPRYVPKITENTTFKMPVKN